MSKIAIIGTAGRDKNIPMTRALWEWMVKDIASRIGFGDHLVSGGAAWADHLAVAMFLGGNARYLTLHLPAPFEDGRYSIPDNSRESSGSAANWYHWKFSTAIGRDTLLDIEKAAAMDNCDGTFEPAAHGYGAMFNRNKKVAASADLMYAYTFGTGATPADGGTKDTWDQCKGKRIHVPLPRL